MAALRDGSLQDTSDAREYEYEDCAGERKAQSVWVRTGVATAQRVGIGSAVVSKSDGKLRRTRGTQSKVVLGEPIYLVSGVFAGRYKCLTAGCPLSVAMEFVEKGAACYLCRTSEAGWWKKPRQGGGMSETGGAAFPTTCSGSHLNDLPCPLLPPRL